MPDGRPVTCLQGGRTDAVIERLSQTVGPFERDDEAGSTDTEDAAGDDSRPNAPLQNT